MDKRFYSEYGLIIDRTKIGIEENVTIFDEDFGTLDDICDLLNKQNETIVDLEAKLAESKEGILQREREIEDLKNCEFVATILDFNKLSADNIRLREQLAEYEEIKKKYRTIFLDRFVDTKVEDARIWKEKYDQLKQQLAESEKKYETLYKLFSEQHEIIDQYELECFEEVNRLLKEQKDFYVVEKDEYDKMVSGAKQFAKETVITELEKVKKRFNDRLDNFYLPLDHRQTLKEVFEQIDQQIKSLKGEK